MAVKPRKKEPTLAELLAQYGRNIASDVPVVGRRIAEGVRSLPEMADTGSRFALGAAQRLGDILPPELRGPALRGDYRSTFNAGVDTAQLLGSAGNQLVTGTSQRALDAMGAPRGAGYDPGATRMSRGAQDAIVSGAQALPRQMYDSPLSTAYEAAMMVAPIPGKMVGKAMKGAGALAGKAARGRRSGVVADALPARPAYIREQSGPYLNVRRAGVEPQLIPEAENAILPELRDLLANPETNPAFRAADAYTRAKFGRGYDLSAPDPSASLAKQAGIARVFDLAASGDDAYKKALFERYGETMPEVVEQAKAQNYDQLTEAAYRRLAEETRNQFDVLPIQTSFHGGVGEYPQPSAMLRDVMSRGRLNVFQGGDRHDFLHDIDPATSLTSNEQFRAVHDFFGHGTRGSTFRPGGEEAAYASHAQMMSPLAQMALAAETRGQNSWVNFGPANADIIREQNRIRRGQALLARAESEWGSSPNMSENTLAAKRADIEEALAMLGDPATAAARLRELGAGYQYAPQSALLLPPEYLPADTVGGVPDYLRPLIKGRSGTGAERGLHFSTKEDLSRTDPSAYGTGHRGSEYNVTAGRPRTYFYTGEPGTVTPEQALFQRGPRTPYQAELSGLYPLAEDPDRLLALANAYAPTAKRSGQTLSALEQLVQTYGYPGYKGALGEKGAAALFEPVDVSRIGEAISAPRPFAQGGAVAPTITIG